MKDWMKKLLSVALSVSLLVSINSPNMYAAAIEEPQDMNSLLQKPYLELLELAPQYEFTSRQFSQVRDRLKNEEKGKKDQLEQTEENIEKQIKAAQDQLKQLNAKAAIETDETKTQRQAIHCQIQTYQGAVARFNLGASQAVFPTPRS